MYQSDCLYEFEIVGRGRTFSYFYKIGVFVRILKNEIKANNSDEHLHFFTTTLQTE
jgi:hypothetical protein